MPINSCSLTSIFCISSDHFTLFSVFKFVAGFYLTTLGQQGFKNLIEFHLQFGQEFLPLGGLCHPGSRGYLAALFLPVQLDASVSVRLKGHGFSSYISFISNSLKIIYDIFTTFGPRGPGAPGFPSDP